MKTYISLPEGIEGYFRALYPSHNVILGHDPEGAKVGSGGAVKYLLKNADLSTKNIVINAGGESRRLPAYNGYGKVLIPIPVAKWSRGQKISQRLFELQTAYLERIANKSPESIVAVVASGDVLLTLPALLPPLPEADIILVGLWSDAATMGKHGVFLCDPEDPRYYEGMVQKPSMQELDRLGKTYLTLLDSGTWLLSKKALDYLRNKPDPLDLYTDLTPFPDDLKVAIYPIEEGDFYHFGSSADLIDSTMRYQNRFRNQRRLLSKRWKLHGAAFVQNAILERKLSEDDNRDIWIENAYIPSTWILKNHHILTGIPRNNLSLSIPEGICIDIVPLKGQPGYALKIYGYSDTFKEDTYLGKAKVGDLFEEKLFPYMKEIGELPDLLNQVLSGTVEGRFSLKELPEITDWEALEAQRIDFYREGLALMQKNWDRSVFYHSDLLDAGRHFCTSPLPLPENASPIIRMQDAAFRAEIGGGNKEEASARLEELLSEGQKTNNPDPYRNIFSDQLIWSRSPVRIDLAGGWSDTPPYCVFEGGAVVNLSVTLNGQEPVQAYVKPSQEEAIILNSIDLGVTETIDSIEKLRDFKKVGSAFSIPKAALVLCGVGNDESSWHEVIDGIGGGIEVTLFSAVPAGSGLGTSSILGATVLSALSEYFGLKWDKEEVCRATLILEQMLTTGGGWQDQYGGIYGGIKLLTTDPGIKQSPTVKFLPEQVFFENQCQVLFYTGITRRAKDILSRIKDKMMLNDHTTLTRLRYIKAIGLEMSEAVGKADYARVGHLLRESWEANKALDPGCTTPEIDAISGLIDDLSLGYKLPGAGGGGFMYILAKDPDAALLIKERLKEKSRGSARVIEMAPSLYGNRTTRS